MVLSLRVTSGPIAGVDPNFKAAVRASTCENVKLLSTISVVRVALRVQVQCVSRHCMHRGRVRSLCEQDRGLLCIVPC